MSKNWKDHLLSSGVPLEYSVGRVLQELVGGQPGEFTYERDDSDGVRKVFSIDVQSSHIDTERNFWLEALVECKYRHDGTRWVFTPREYDSHFGTDFNDLFVTLDQCCLDRKVDRDVIGKFRGHYPLCEKGIELLANDANQLSISDDQLLHGLRRERRRLQCERRRCRGAVTICSGKGLSNPALDATGLRPAG